MKRVKHCPHCDRRVYADDGYACSDPECRRRLAKSREEPDERDGLPIPAAANQCGGGRRVVRDPRGLA